jgi:hypothetical protein
MTSLQQAWASLPSRLKLMEPLRLSAADWSVIEHLHVNFNDREAHTHLPIAIARFYASATRAIYDLAKQFDDLKTIAGSADDPMAHFAHLYNDDVDEMMSVLVPSALYRKGHYAYGKFTVASPHGLHTDHSAEDPAAAGEPICIARIETLGTHYISGGYKEHDARLQSMLKALRYWISVPEGEPEAVLDELLERQTLKTIPVNHVMLMVAGNGSPSTQVTQHIAARPPKGGLHSAFFQRQYRVNAGERHAGWESAKR